MKNKSAILGLLAMASLASMGGDMPMERRSEVGVTGNFNGLKHGKIKNRKPKTMGNHKRSKKRRN
jgi:hypothetical protein